QCFAVGHSGLVAILLEAIDDIEGRTHECLVEWLARLADPPDALRGLAALKSEPLGGLIGSVLLLWQWIFFGRPRGEAGQVEFPRLSETQITRQQAALSVAAARRSSRISPVSCTALST